MVSLSTITELFADYAGTQGSVAKLDEQMNKTECQADRPKTYSDKTSAIHFFHCCVDAGWIKPARYLFLQLQASNG